VTTAPPALALDHIEKRFGNVHALTDASLVVRQGSIHALLGENGAGKTTLMRVAYGMESPDGGAVRMRGSPVRLRSPRDAIAHGIGMVHQHFTLVPAMTVAENLALGGHGVFHREEAIARIENLTRETGFVLDPTARVRNLSVTSQQRLELMKLLSRDASVLILDEPTAVLAPSEADELLRRLRQLADSGRAVILITHKLREALQVADDITVLRRGRTTLTTSVGSVDEDRLINAMLGQRTKLDPSPARRTRTFGDSVIRASGVSIKDGRGITRIRDATFEVRAGEVVGVAAIEGSGQRELLRTVSGRLPVSAGTLALPASIGFVPDDRHRDGLVLEMTLAENYALKGAGQRRGLLRLREYASAARAIIDEFDVRAEDERAISRSLSGGNQQKFILGRELHPLPAAIVVENPTRGLDIAATAYVKLRLLEACNSGVAIVFYSADIDELVSVADRVLVVFGGTVTEVPPVSALVGRAMLGAA